MNDELKNIVVFGTGNTARVVIEIIEVKGKYNILGLIDATKARIGEHTVVGAGSTVMNDIPAYTISYGTPCKIIKKRRQGDKYF